MDKTFQKLLQTDIDLSSLGVERRTDNEPYFCTPKGASVFGWTGVDGIHFCFVRGFGGMVFAVSPARTFCAIVEEQPMRSVPMGGLLKAYSCS